MVGDKMSEKTKIPVIALRDLIIFPRTVSHFDCGRSKSIAAIEEAEMKDSKVFLIAQKDGEIENPKADDLFEYGTIAIIKQILKLPGGIVRVLVEGATRAKAENIETEGDYIKASYQEFIEKEEEQTNEILAAKRLVKEDIDEYSNLDTKLVPGLLQSVVDESTASSLVDTAAMYISLELKEAQELLETLDPYDRMLKFHAIMKRELELLSIEKNIDSKVKYNMNKLQKEYYLKEQIKVINKELGEDSEEDTIINYEIKIEEKNLPQYVKEKAEKELSKLKKVNSASPEYTVILNYLDWILDLPWTEMDEEDIDLNKAREILNNEHYGLKEIKERILEFIAVRKLSEGSHRGPILCFVGPPGVGKTSIASSIAKALNKEFVRMSVGGVTDEAEIRGHRRTYVGAMPGRIINLIKKAGKNNPVFLFDEIDKIGNDYRGDPASAMLEVLDPEQNNTFTDRYLELPFDLSNVFFIATANTTQTIPDALLDRMEIIRLSGYTAKEKFEIAKKHLIKKQTKENGLTPSKFKISDSALRKIIDNYTREAGVRGLEKEISKAARHTALDIIENDKKSISLTIRNLTEFLGEEKYSFDTVDKLNKIGSVTGLAWTRVGGVTLEVETAIMKGTGKLTLTGQLGNVMKESAMAAISYIASNSEYYKVSPDFRTKKDIHIHVPEGAVPKDGPSAGVTMVTSVLSALTKRKVYNDIAMTGEISLRGKVMPIGGLKEKLLAAERMGIKRVVVPIDNKKDVLEIEDDVTKNLEIHYAKDVKEVIKLALKEK